MCVFITPVSITATIWLVPTKGSIAGFVIPISGTDSASCVCSSAFTWMRMTSGCAASASTSASEPVNENIGRCPCDPHDRIA